MERLRRLAAVRWALTVHKRYSADGGGHLAAALTYYAFLSLFPLILLALAVIGFVLAGDPVAQRAWAGRLSGSVPGLGPLIGENIATLVEHRGGASIVGIAGLVWSGTGLTNAAGYALGRVFRRPEVEGFVQKKIWALSSTAGLGIVALAGVVVSGFVASLKGSGVAGLALGTVATTVSFGLDVLLFLCSYRILTAGWGPPFSKLWPGALLAATGWTALKVGGAWYAAHTVSSASEVYGVFGSVVGILAMLYLASRLFLYGAELDAAIIDERAGDLKRLDSQIDPVAKLDRAARSR